MTRPNASTLAVIALLCSATAAMTATNRDVRFTHPSAITNHYLPLASLKQQILEGREGRHRVRIERTRLRGSRSIKVYGHTVPAMIVEDREFTDGALSEVTSDYFAQSDEGTVYYLGEQVNQYKNGHVVAHEGQWLTGVDTQTPGVLFPAHPRVGEKFHSESVPGITMEEDTVVSVSETVTAGRRTYRNCVKIRENSGEIEYKYYAPGVGVVREASGSTHVDLKS